MGSQVTVTLVGGSTTLAEECMTVGHELETLWSRFREESELSQLARGGRQRVDPRTVRLIEHMRTASVVTDGAFNPTLVREIIRLGYARSLTGSALAVQPSRTETHQTIADVTVEGDTVTLPEGMALDAGGIGKGFAADLVVEYARERGVDGVLANFGGDIAVWGDAPDGGAWRIGVDDPFADDTHLDIIRMSTGAIATSSQRVRRFSTLTSEGSHLINPRTGSSVETEVQTVTVIAGAGWFAEACAKPGFLWPTSGFLHWIPTVNAAALVVLSDGSVQQSTNWGLYA